MTNSNCPVAVIRDEIWDGVSCRHFTWNCFYCKILPSVLWHCWLGVRKRTWLVKNWSDEMLAWLMLAWLSDICLKQHASDLSSWCHGHPIIYCFIRIQIGLSALLAACPGCPGKEAVRQVSVCCCRMCPIFQVSNVTGENLSLLRMFLNLLSTRMPCDYAAPAEFQIDETFAVPVCTLYCAAVVAWWLSSKWFWSCMYTYEWSRIWLSFQLDISSL